MKERMKDRDEELAGQFVSDDWFEKAEPPEITTVAKSIEKSTALRPAAIDKKEGPPPDDPQRYVAGDRSTALDGFGSVALDRLSYFATERLSDNVNRSPEGYLICKNAVIGRTGFQTYKIAEIADPEGLLEGYRADDEIDLYRGPEEVFSRETLASFEGKSFCLGHPTELLDPETERLHHQGHVQNVRAGSEPLGNGELPLLADIIVKGEAAIRAIENGARELSCGYSYRLARTGYRWEMRDIIGNHVALVESGRAGSSARIYDSLPTAKRRKPLNEIAATDAMYREHGRRQVEAIRNQIRRPR